MMLLLEDRIVRVGSPLNIQCALYTLWVMSVDAVTREQFTCGADDVDQVGGPKLTHDNALCAVLSARLQIVEGVLALRVGKLMRSLKL
jgi:hypothetical protein